MEDLLLKYFTVKKDWEAIVINNYTIDGAVCHVRYTICNERESESINIWEMLVFLNNNK